MSLLYISEYMKKYEDPRTANWPLIKNGLHTLTIIITYLFIVKIAGPKFMKNRKPFELRNTLVVYNLFQVVLSCLMFYGFAAGGWLTGDYNYQCQPIDFSNSPQTILMVHVTYWYFISKFTELPETVFFIMRKKDDQVNILHVFHHAIMPFSAWLGAKYYPNGHGTLVGLLNTFVHIVMYSYYLLSAFGPGIQKYLWWKKYITALQLVQFSILTVHTFQLFFTECNFPRVFIFYMCLLSITFYGLFASFYNRKYKLKKA